MENRTLGIRCRIVARIPTGIHRFDGNSHKIRSDSYRIRVGPVVGLNLLGSCGQKLNQLVKNDRFLERWKPYIVLILSCSQKAAISRLRSNQRT